jgi:CheY-like chemotaxis protein
MNKKQNSETELEEPTEEMVSKIPIDILFVDDNPSFLEITERYFETSNHDFTVETCQNSEDALEKMQTSTS